MSSPRVTLTPLNRVSRDDLCVLVRNNTLNNSAENVPDDYLKDSDSPLRQPGLSLRPILSKKLFHSPAASPIPKAQQRRAQTVKKINKRKQMLLPSTCTKIKKAFMNEIADSNESKEEMRQIVFVSLFHNKEYSVDLSHN